MKKNNKGFTMVELLAAIVILGILSVFALPIITGMVENSRNKMYISDARKLISQAEYQLKASSSTIERPDPGDCIVISMHYLDNSAFTSAPNGGEYEIDHSFVVVKNVNGKYEYSASIVEKLKKGGYKGVILTSEKDLLKKRANTQYVKTFKESDLVDVEYGIDKTYVNSYLGSDYISGEVSDIYHYRDLEDSNIQNIQDSSPVINSASITPTGELKTVLSIKATDADTPRNNLNIYLAVDSGYSDTNPISYGNSVDFNYDIDFSKYGYSFKEGGKATVYIVIKDPNGNTTKKEINHEINKNNAPVIQTATLTHLENDEANMLTATLKVKVTDDLDNYSNLLFCVKESNSNGAVDCNNYVSYNDFFSNKENGGGTVNYKFKECKNGCKRDGSTQYLTIFVRDSMLATSSTVASYKFSTNQKPVLTASSVSVTSGPASFLDESGGGSKDVKVSVSVTDDVDSGSNLTVNITDGVTSKQYPYNENDSVFDFSLAGDYTGTVQQRTKKISVYVTDKEGANSDVIEKSYLLYENKAPSINYFVVSSDGTACSNGKLCPLSSSTDDSEITENGNHSIDDSEITKNGSLNTVISFSVVDDIDVDNNYGNIEVCISQVKSDCDVDANYKPYSYYSSLEKIGFKLDGQYKGSEAERTKTIYMKIKDHYGLTASAEREYVLYEDKVPIIAEENGFEMESKTGSFVTDAVGDINAYIRLNAEDDFDSDNLLFTLKHNGREVISNEPISSLYHLQDTGEVDKQGNPMHARVFDYLYSVSNQYDGSQHQFEVFVTDSNGYHSSTKTFTYKVYKNLAPKIGGASVASINGPDGKNTLDVYFNTGLSDDIDSVMSIQYCYKIGTGAAHCMDPINSSGMAHLTKNNLFSDFTGGYNGQTLKIYAIATDSGGLSSTSQVVNYKLFTAKVPVIKNVTAYHDPDHDSFEELGFDDPGENVSDDPFIMVSFEISDSSLEDYSVCLSNNNTCTNFSGSYEAGEVYTVPLQYPGTITSTAKAYFYAKNSVEKSTVKSVTIGTSSNVNNCKFLLESSKYEYTPRGNKKITTSACDNKCYHNNTIIGDTNTYSAPYNYKLTINYYDRLNDNSLCPSYTTTTNNFETKYCDFKDCFYNSEKNSYKQKVVGSFLHDDDAPWTMTLDGITYELDSHYSAYESEYHDGDKDITLTEVGTLICPYCYDNGLYGDQYKIRVADFDAAN